MIKFDPNKNKNISFNINVQGIDPSMLEYNLRLSNGQVDYGFKGDNRNGEIQFNIPALNEIVGSDVLYELNTVKLEVHDKNNKYYLKPFQDEIKIKEDVKVEVENLEEKSEEGSESEFTVDASLNETQDNIPSPQDKKETVSEKNKKQTKFGKFLKG